VAEFIDVVRVEAELWAPAGGRFAVHAGRGFLWVCAPLAWALVDDPESAPPVWAQVVAQRTDADGGCIALTLAVPSADVARLGEARPVQVRVHRPVAVRRPGTVQTARPGRLLPRLPDDDASAARRGRGVPPIR
jgi:hypothetical protein